MPSFMEYEFYVESKYGANGVLKTRILTAAEAEKLGYEDGYQDVQGDTNIYANGFSSRRAAKDYVDDLIT